MEMFEGPTSDICAVCARAAGVLDAAAAALSRAYFEESLLSIERSRGDVYYAAFSAMGSRALGGGLGDLEGYLRSLDFSSFDLPHLASFARCANISGAGFGGLASAVERAVARTPYEVFLKSGALRDCGIPQGGETGLAGLERFCAPGGYSNIPGAPFAGANATSAALAALAYSGSPEAAGCAILLREMQEPCGGVRAEPGSPHPDLLTTACALFALGISGVEPRFCARDFAAAHWAGDGSFCASVCEDRGDCEYALYGILALGACA